MYDDMLFDPVGATADIYDRSIEIAEDKGTPKLGSIAGYVLVGMAIVTAGHIIASAIDEQTCSMAVMHECEHGK